MRKVDGYAINGDDLHWTVNCPNCDYEIEYKGYFDATDVNICPKCMAKFLTSKVWLDKKYYIE
jgi:ssDNA-binding Zn-finger/Zn-ribbon topoisomerase 1